MNFKRFSKAAIAVVLLAGMSYACTTKKANKYPGFTKAADGLYYKFYKRSDDTAKARIGDKVSAYMNYRTMNDSIFSKSQPGHPFELPMMKSTYKGDVFAALKMMSPGDSATFVINTDSFFQKTVGAPRPALLDSGSTFLLDVKVIKIMTPAEMDKERMQTEKAMAQLEKSTIANYIATNKLNVKPDPSGIFFLVTKKGKGAKAAAGEYAKLNIVAKTIGPKGAEFINTYNDGKPIDLEIGTGQLGVGFETGLMKMKVGEKATMVVPFSLAFGAQGMRGYVPPYATIVYDVQLLKLTSAKQMKAQQEAQAKKAMAGEASLINKYLKSHNINVKPTADGLYYIQEVAGTGKQAVAGDKVKVHYTGYLLDGTKFDSSVDRGKPFEFTLGQHQVIPGWDEAIAMMKEGGKAKLVIPSNLAYGSRGAGKIIPPNSPLVFDVELIKVEK